MCCNNSPRRYSPTHSINVLQQLPTSMLITHSINVLQQLSILNLHDTQTSAQTKNRTAGPGKSDLDKKRIPKLSTAPMCRRRGLARRATCGHLWPIASFCRLFHRLVTHCVPVACALIALLQTTMRPLWIGRFRRPALRRYFLIAGQSLALVADSGAVSFRSPGAGAGG